MRWYKIEAAGLTFDATGDPNALNVEMDIPVAPEHIPKAGAFCRVWGIPLQMLLNAKSYNNQAIKVYGGMQKGLPLANPGQQGLLTEGKIFPALGNWVGTDMTLDFYIAAGKGENNPGKDVNLVHDWPANTPMKGAIDKALKNAYPAFKRVINISDNLKLPHDDRGPYQRSGQYANYLFSISKGILGNMKDYPGVNMVFHGDTIYVDDGTQNSSGNIQINFQDLIGQPIWTGIKTIQFKTVMRGDIMVMKTVTLPKTLATLTPAAGTQVGGEGSNIISGNFRIDQIRHTGNFRQPDWPSWASTFDATQVP